MSGHRKRNGKKPMELPHFLLREACMGGAELFDGSGYDITNDFTWRVAV